MMLDQKVYKLLKDHWGYETFRPLQEGIIAAILDGSDVLAVLPTGAGKSLCFQIPALAREGLTLVISPLIALMNDQVSQLKKRGIKAAAVHSQMEWMDVQSQLNRAHHGQLDLLYISPERLASERFVSQISDTNINCLVVDEAHCVSMWGYDFRPAYLEIARFREVFPSLQCVATTATATDRVFSDIIDKLELDRPATFRAPILRENLRFGVLQPEDKEATMEKILRQIGGPSIIYVGRRRTAHELQRHLSRKGFNATAYHAGLEKDERSRIESDFIKGDRQVMIATNAFGMGVDKSDVRLVLHYDIPSTMEAYYQEAGRAGRDGQVAYAIALYASSDLERQSVMHKREFPDEKMIRSVYHALGSYFKLALGSGLEETFSFDLINFSARYKLDQVAVGSALKVLQRAGWLSLEDESRESSTVQFVLPANELYDYRQVHPESDATINHLLRLHEGILYHPTTIREEAIASALKIDLSLVHQQLRQLHQAGIIDYVSSDGSPRITFLRERVAEKNMTIDRARYKFRKERSEQALSILRQYLETSGCRQKFISTYFGQDLETECGACDYCRKQRQGPQVDDQKLRRAILQSLVDQAKSLDDILHLFEHDDHDHVLRILQGLVDEEFVHHINHSFSISHVQ